MQIKSAPFKVKSVGTDEESDDYGTFTGYASVFGNKDSYGDVVVKGAFSETLKAWGESGNTLPVLYGHDFGDPFSNIGAVTEAKEDDHGLLVTAQLDMDNPKAAQVHRLMKGGRLSQMSFAFDIEEAGNAKSEELGDYYELSKLKLFEVSIVPIGANQETEIVGVKHAIERLDTKSLTGDALDALRDAHATISDILTSADESNVVSASADEASVEDEAKSEEPDTAKGEELESKASVEWYERYFKFL